MLHEMIGEEFLQINQRMGQYEINIKSFSIGIPTTRIENVAMNPNNIRFIRAHIYIFPVLTAGRKLASVEGEG